MRKIRIVADDHICFTSSGFLHRYLAIDEKMEQSLRENYLWFADPLEFNDPYDCNMEVDCDCNYEEVLRYLRETNKSQGYNMSDKLLKIKAKKLVDDPAEMELLSKKSDMDTVSKLGVCCFSQRDDNLLMWSHYGDKHKGVCLTFDITEDKNLFGKQLFNLEYPSIYPKHRFPADAGKFLALRFLIATKSRDWEYEDEIRVVRDDTNPPFRGKVPFNKKSLVGIKFGYKCPLEERTRINTLLIRIGGYDHVKFYTANLKKKAFGIEIQEIER